MGLQLGNPANFVDSVTAGFVSGQWGRAYLARFFTDTGLRDDHWPIGTQNGQDVKLSMNRLTEVFEAGGEAAVREYIETEIAILNVVD